MATTPERRIAIIGSGFSGLCLGIQLVRAGMRSFTIFEKADRPGGTWRDNSYPGAACDVPSFAYCFSFAQKTDWTRKWSPQARDPRVHEDACAREYGILDHIRFGTEIASARWDEGGMCVAAPRTTAAEDFVADVLVSGGQLNRPSIPTSPGSIASGASASTRRAGTTRSISATRRSPSSAGGERDPVHSGDRAEVRTLRPAAHAELDAAPRRPRRTPSASIAASRAFRAWPARTAGGSGSRTSCASRSSSGAHGSRSASSRSRATSSTPRSPIRRSALRSFPTTRSAASAC